MASLLSFSSRRPRHTLFHSLFIFRLVFELVLAKNVTVDNQDPEISYSPPNAWTLSAPNALDYGGTHMKSRHQSAAAEFRFTGTAVYFLSPLWPYPVSSSVSLDSGPENILNLSWHCGRNYKTETLPSRVAWSATGLADTIHVIRVHPPFGNPENGYAIVDGFIYTINEELLPTSSESAVAAPIPSPTSFLYQPLKKRHVRPLPVALGTVFSILGVFCIALALWYFIRMRQLRKNRGTEAWVDVAKPSIKNISNGSSKLDSPPASYTNGTKSNTGVSGQPIPTSITPLYSYRYPITNVVSVPPPRDAGFQRGRVPTKYEAGHTLSTITEKSTPQMHSPQTLPHSPSLKGSPLVNPGGLSPASFASEELESSGYYTAHGSVSEESASGDTGGDSTKVGYHENFGQSSGTTTKPDGIDYPRV